MSHTPVRSTGLQGVRLALFLALVHAVTDGTTAILGAILPTLQARFELGPTPVAFLVAAYTIAASVTQPLFGGLAEERGLHRVGAAGVLLACVCLSLLGVTHSLWVVFILLLFGGFGSAALHPVGSAAAAASTQPAGSIGVGIFATGGMIGLAMGPVLVLALIDGFGVRVTPWVMLPGVLLSVLTFTLMPRWEPRAARPLSDRLGLRQLRGPIRLLVVSNGMTTAAFLSFTGAFPMWLVSTTGLPIDASLIGWTLAVFAFSAGVGSLFGGPLAEVLGRRCVLVGSLLLAVVPLSATLWTEPGSVLYFLFVCSGGALGYMGNPVLIVFAQELCPAEPASISGVMVGMSSAIGALVYVMLGWIQDQAGLSVGLALGFALMLPAAAIAQRVLTRNPRAL